MAGALKRRQQALGNKELAAEEKILQDLFYDLYRNRRHVYSLNFWRGVFFGLGSVIGATIVIAIVVAIISLFTQIPGGVGDFFRWIVDTIGNR